MTFEDRQRPGSEMTLEEIPTSPAPRQEGAKGPGPAGSPLEDGSPAKDDGQVAIEHERIDRVANLVVTEGEIFKEKTKVKHVFVDGRWFEVHEAPSGEKGGEKKPPTNPDEKAGSFEEDAGANR